MWSVCLSEPFWFATSWGLRPSFCSVKTNNRHNVNVYKCYLFFTISASSVSSIQTECTFTRLAKLQHTFVWDSLGLLTTSSVCQSLTINTCKDINKKRKKNKSNELFSKENKGMLTKDQGKSSSAQQKLQAAILSAIYDTAFRIWIELYLFIYCFLYLLFTVLSAPDPNDTCLFFLLWYWFYCIISLSSSSIMHSSCCW